MADLKKLAEEIVNLTLLEAQELKTILKDEYGIEPAAGGVSLTDTRLDRPRRAVHRRWRGRFTTAVRAGAAHSSSVTAPCSRTARPSTS